MTVSDKLKLNRELEQRNDEHIQSFQAKVINGLKSCINYDRDEPDCVHCPYLEIKGTCTVLHKLHGDALKLIEERMFDFVRLTKKERINKYGEVFTPDWLVKKMCDTLEESNPEEDVFAPWKTFLEPTCGEGAFVVEILRRKFSRCKSKRDYRTAIESVYAMEIQADNVQKTIDAVKELCSQYFKLSKDDIQIINDHVIQCDSLKVMKMLADERLQDRVQVKSEA